jgi:hypothetical protein
LLKNEFYYFKNNFQKIFAYLKNFIICAYIIYYQKFLSNFHPLTSGRPKLPARCPLYNTCMITRLRPSMVPLLYPPGNPRTKSPWPEDSRGFSEGLLSGYRISVYYMPIPEGHIWSIVSVLR